MQKYILQFSQNSTKLPILSTLISKFDLSINIIKANVYPGKYGEMLVELDIKNKSEAINDYLKNLDVKLIMFKKKLIFNNEKCLNCGACTAVCLTSALSICSPEWKLEFNHDKCILCGLCVESCPLKLFSIKELC